jgi:hypothetical protein
VAGVEPAASGGWVGLPDGYYLLIHPDPGSASKTAPLWVFRAMLVGLARRRCGGGGGASGLVLASD